MDRVQGTQVATRLSLSRFKLAGPPTPRDTEASNAYAIIHDSLGPVCICSLIGINSSKYKGWSKPSCATCPKRHTPMPCLYPFHSSHHYVTHSHKAQEVAPKSPSDGLPGPP